MKQATAPAIPPAPITAYAPMHVTHIGAVTGVGTAHEPPHATAMLHVPVLGERSYAGNLVINLLQGSETHKLPNRIEQPHQRDAN